MEPVRDIFEEWAEERAKKPWIIRKLNYIPLWWNHDGRFLYRNFIIGVKNLFYWFPVIWKDRNWDDHFIFEVLKHKLKAQSIYIGSRDRHTRAQQDARRMRICVSLIEKIQEETYAMEQMDYHKDKHWFTPVEGKSNLSKWNSKTIEENFDDYFKKYPLIYKRVMNGEGPFSLQDRDEDEIKKIIAMNIAHINQERAHRLLFKILEQNIRGWWD